MTACSARWMIFSSAIIAGWSVTSSSIRAGCSAAEFWLRPASIKDIDVVYRRITLSIARDEFEHGPGVETNLPVSRQNEIALSQHYGWPRFWEEHPGGGVIAPATPSMQPLRSKDQPADPAARGAANGDGDPHLRSAREIEGYHIEATDGEIGHVDDLIVDDETWTIRYMPVDTRNWMPGRRVLVAPAWVTAIDWYGHLISRPRPQSLEQLSAERTRRTNPPRLRGSASRTSVMSPTGHNNGPVEPIVGPA